MVSTETGEWHRVIARLGAERELLVDDFLTKLSQTGLYERYGISDSDLRLTAAEGVDMLVAQLAGDRLPERLRDVPVRLGVRRARQGVERDDLLEAVRLDFRVMWAGLIRAAGPDSDAILVHHALHVLSIVEQYINSVHVAYLDERERLASDSRLDEMRAMSALFTATNVEQVADTVQHRLRFRPHQPLEVFCALHEHATALRRGLAEQRRHVVTWEFEDATAFVREDIGGDLPPSVRAVPSGFVSDVPRLADLPQAVELARRIARLARVGDGPTTEAQSWPAIVHDELRQSLPSALPRGVERIHGLPELEQERMLETVQVYWLTGSIKTTAERLFVHRNTIVNRLNAFARVTDLDPTIPAQAARAIIALGARTPEEHPLVKSTTSAR